MSCSHSRHWSPPDADRLTAGSPENDMKLNLTCIRCQFFMGNEMGVDMIHIIHEYM